MYKITYNCIMLCNIPKYGIKPPYYETLEYFIFCMSYILIATTLYCINVHLALKYGNEIYK